MKSGLLIYDNTPQKLLTTKIADAAKRYKEKFGVRPDTAFVNPLDLTAALAPVPNIQVNGKPTILRNYIWLGLDNTPTLAPMKD